MNNLKDNELYCLGLIAEEMAEVTKLIGKSLRFGIDSPSCQDAPYYGMTAREMLHEELGDVFAAIAFAIEEHEIFDGDLILARLDKKLAKLKNPESKDNLGRPLAPLSEQIKI